MSKRQLHSRKTNAGFFDICQPSDGPIAAMVRDDVRRLKLPLSDAVCELECCHGMSESAARLYVSLSPMAWDAMVRAVECAAMDEGGYVWDEAGRVWAN